MSKITLTKEVKRGSINHDVSLDITEYGCTVSALGTDHAVPWENMDDVEWLADTFGDLPVFLFKVIVQTLGQVYNSQDSYKEQLS
jgi:hypothetical protein